MIKLLVFTLFFISLYANEGKIAENDELIKYSSLSLNEQLGFYAAEVYMNSLDNEQTFSLGLLLSSETKNNAEYGLGYVKVTENSTSMLNPVNSLHSNENDGVLFFMNYKF